MPDALALACGGRDRHHRHALFRRPRDEDRRTISSAAFRRCGTSSCSICCCCGPTPVIAAATIALFAVLTFVPIRFVHPFRVRRLRTVTVALLTLWAALALAAVKQGLAPAPWISAALCLIAVYFVLVGLLPARSDPK